LIIFNHNDIDFWRYKPGIGIEVSHFIKNKYDIIPHTGLLLNVGVEYPIDFVEHNRTKYLGFRPAVSLRYAIGE
jgi:hypothetical protein